jgi:Arc/MetJ family transcription regulator
VYGGAGLIPDHYGDFKSCIEKDNWKHTMEFRGYRAQIPEPVIDLEPPPAGPTWPQKRYYRAYCQEDDDAVAAVMAKYGIHNKEEAIRLALRLAAGDAIKVTTSAPAARRLVIKIKAKGASG